MEIIQDTSQQLPFVPDFNSLILERKPFNTTGGFGDVYKANHPQFGLFARKRPRGLGDPGSANYRHLLHEAALRKAARHPNVLQFLGTWEANETVYLVSPFLDNGTVMQYLTVHPNADRTKFILDIARGLAYLHETDIVHGDIKGSNILVSPTVDALVADFGLAKLADSSTVPSLKGAGSLRWQSPEVLRGEAHRTFSSDVYSFGMTIYETLSGAIPFDGVNPYGVITLVTIGKKRPELEPKLSPSGLSYAMQWKAARCSWNNNPQLRPNMGAVQTWLESSGVVKGRIRVVCARRPQFNGCIAQIEPLLGPCAAITGNISKARVYQCPTKGTCPRMICDMIHPGSAVTPSAGAHSVAKVPQTSWWSRELNAAIIRIQDGSQTIPLSTLPARIWRMSDDGELCPSRFSDYQLHQRELMITQPLDDPGVMVTEGKLYPVVLTTVTPTPLVFCTELIQTEHFPNAHMEFEEIDDDALS